MTNKDVMSSVVETSQPYKNIEKKEQKKLTKHVKVLILSSDSLQKVYFLHFCQATVDKIYNIMLS